LPFSVRDAPEKEGDREPEMIQAAQRQEGARSVSVTRCD